MLDLAYAKREHDAHDAANHGERRDPGDEKNGAATVVAGGPEAERERMKSLINNGRFAGTLEWAGQGSNLRPWD